MTSVPDSRPGDARGSASMAEMAGWMRKGSEERRGVRRREGRVDKFTLTVTHSEALSADPAA
eukprot:768628-Hanusia_phi.AAC.4